MNNNYLKLVVLSFEDDVKHTDMESNSAANKVYLTVAGMGKHRRTISEVYSMKDANILAILGISRLRSYQLRAPRHSFGTGFYAYNS